MEPGLYRRLVVLSSTLVPTCTPVNCTLILCSRDGCEVLWSASVCPLAYLKNHEICARYLWPVLLWRQCNTLCTSGFVDDVI